jgi:hypothetical protein
MVRPQVADGGTASRYGGLLRIHWISSRGQLTRGGPPAWGLGEVLTTPHHKKLPSYKSLVSLQKYTSSRLHDTASKETALFSHHYEDLRTSNFIYWCIIFFILKSCTNDLRKWRAIRTTLQIQRTAGHLNSHTRSYSKTSMHHFSGGWKTKTIYMGKQ